jgi:hypothetical protein
MVVSGRASFARLSQEAPNAGTVDNSARTQSIQVIVLVFIEASGGESLLVCPRNVTSKKNTFWKIFIQD